MVLVVVWSCWPPGRGWFCAGARPPSWWGVLRWWVPAPLVGRAVLVYAPHQLWGVLRSFVPPLMMGRAVLVRGLSHGGACCVVARRPRRWCVVWWCFTCIVMVCWFAVAVVLFAWPGLVLCWCVPPPPPVGACRVRAWPPLVGRAVSACLGFGSWCCSRLDARLVLLVCCCLRHCMASIVWYWLSVVFAWPGLVLCWHVPPPPVLGRAVLMHGPPLARACCVPV